MLGSSRPTSPAATRRATSRHPTAGSAAGSGACRVTSMVDRDVTTSRVWGVVTPKYVVRLPK